VAAWEPGLPLARRHYRRWDTDFATTISIGGEVQYCSITDISPGGATLRLLSPRPVGRGMSVSLSFEGYGQVSAKLCRCNHEVLGVKFSLDRQGGAAFSQWMIGSALQRRRLRQNCRVEAVALVVDGEFPCIVGNVSNMGARIEFDEPERLSVGRDMVLLWPGQRAMPTSVRFIAGSSAGLCFLDGYDRQWQF
jgi:hypothetical protein